MSALISPAEGARRALAEIESGQMSSRQLADVLQHLGGNGANAEAEVYNSVVRAAAAAGLGLPRDLAGNQPALRLSTGPHYLLRDES